MLASTGISVPALISLADVFVKHPVAMSIYTVACLAIGAAVAVLVYRKVTERHGVVPRREARNLVDGLDHFALQFLLQSLDETGPRQYRAQGAGWQALERRGVIYRCEDEGYDTTDGPWWILEGPWRKALGKSRPYMEEALRQMQPSD